MVLSAPNVTFDPAKVSYGTINAGSSSARINYVVKNISKSGSSHATVKNLSISFNPSTNSDEAESESWIEYSTAEESVYVRSLDEGPECAGGSIAQGDSIAVATKVNIPATPATSGTVLFKAHHRYQYTG